ncbi:MAG: hypothetical protein M1826_003372 [Phylliscum demangeonii]|nr:MAG: hypothetical protein M1826_003372 [Phylliscum demangeonii]
MTTSVVHLPNGQTVTVSPVFGGLSFTSNELNTHHAVFPPGWTIVLQTEPAAAADREPNGADPLPAQSQDSSRTQKPAHKHPFTQPTLHDDHLFLASISTPSPHDFAPAPSATRQIALMLWATLSWYFHQPAPDRTLRTPAAAQTAEAGKPRGDWRIYVRREGVFRARALLPKLERMGLIASEASCVGPDATDGAADGSWDHCFVSQRLFWQLDPRIFLFTLAAAPSSPSMAMATPTPTPTPGPFDSASHLPTYFPPPPLQYTVTNEVRHPLRPKPPRQAETFYTRYIPSLGQHLSFRVVCLPPAAAATPSPLHATPSSSLPLPTPPPPSNETPPHSAAHDIELLHKWMNDDRVAYYWGERGPAAHQAAFLRAGLSQRHSFPAIGCWDGRAFGYVEIYWVREDRLGRHLSVAGGDMCDMWDRGLHCLVGEQAFRGWHRFRVWMSALVHYCFLADCRTQNVWLEPRVDNTKFIEYLGLLGFQKLAEIALPHKQAALMRFTRQAWEAPAL